MPRNITSLKREARAVLDEYASAITELQYTDLEKRAFNSVIISEVRGTLGKIEKHGDFWSQVKVAGVSTLIVTFVLIMLSLAISLFGIDPLDGAEKLRQIFRG